MKKTVTILIFLFCPFFLLAEEPFSLEKGWQILRVYTDEEFHPLESLKDIPEQETVYEQWLTGRKKQFYIYLKNELPEYQFKNPFLLLTGTYGSFAVNINDKEIFIYGDDESDSIKFYYPYTLHWIPLSEEHKGKTILFGFYSSDKHIGILGEILIGEYDELRRYIIKNDLDRLIVGFVLFLFSFFLLGKKNKENQWKNFCLAAFAFFGGAMTINFTHVKQLWWNNPAFWNYFSYFLTFAISISFCFFVEQHISNIFLAIVRKALIALGFCSLLIGTLIPIYILHTGINLFIGILCLVIPIVVIINAKKGNTEAKVITLGIVIFGFFVAYDILIQLGITPWTRPIGHWGQLIMTGVFGWAQQHSRQKN